MSFVEDCQLCKRPLGNVTVSITYHASATRKEDLLCIACFSPYLEAIAIKSRLTGLLEGAPPEEYGRGLGGPQTSGG